ncbi:GNAT family N-acetyltransferase [Paenibacillus typhae]|uniref:GNAT family N-acetyltransferase n=1 Tax=Paenibacillus typhae TaxID=1174501 RepID=UPI001C8DC68D|nr:GNAT family N-acetyltransferase [Paenibacillus typhae]MBY0013518.1 GNAT family N-acetyltransferase [Paenibacillus typhae]
MIIKALEQEGTDGFLDYCRKHRGLLDDSFLSDEELAAFKRNAENPTYIAADEQGDIAGAASLILNDYARRGRKARLRILHAQAEDPAVYRGLLQAVLQHTSGLDKLNIFVPSANPGELEKLAAAGFTVERYSCLLIRDIGELPDAGVPEQYELRAFQRGFDEEAWSRVRNAGFARLQGSETPVTPEMVKAMTSGADYIENGMLLLYHGDKAVGVVRGSDDEYGGEPIMNIGPLALLPEYQGKGLGKVLLRAALHTAKNNGYSRSILCVNAENEQAKALYTGEGFREAESAVCFKYDLSSS